jgi:hypothetical protein
MIPIPGLEAVQCAWVEIRADGFTLHGFLVYTMSDHKFPRYMRKDGQLDVEQWATDQCTIFVVQSPSAEWINYAESVTDHPWWRLFGHLLDDPEEARELDERVGDVALLRVRGRAKTLDEVFAPVRNAFRHTREVTKILRRFDLAPTDHPCLILFRDLREPRAWVIDLRDLLGREVSTLRRGLREWFGGREFQQILLEASRA